MKTLLSLRALPVFLLGFFSYFTSFSQISFTTDTMWGCDSLLVTFTNTSGSGTYYNWEFDDGNSYFGVDTAHKFTSPGRYRVRLHAFDPSFNYMGSYEQEIVVYGVGNIYHSPDSACPGDQVQFWHGGAGYSQMWNFGDGYQTGEESPRHIYADTGTYKVTVIVTHPCGTDTAMTYVRVDTAAVPNINWRVDKDSVCPGDQLRFRPSLYSETMQFLWNFGDGSTSAEREPFHAFPGIGDYEVTLSITNNCGKTGSYTDTVRVRSNIGFDFLAADATSGCPGDVIYARAFTSGDVIYPQYVWDMGDGTIDTTNWPQYEHIYADTGMYTVSVMITNGCGMDSTIVTYAQVDSTVYPDLSGCDGQCFGVPEQGQVFCPGDSVVFWFAGEYSSNLWEFGDGMSGVATEVINVGGGGGPEIATIIKHAFADTGSYWVRLTVTNGCGNSTTDSVLVQINDSSGITTELFVTNPSNGPSWFACEKVHMVALGGSTFDWDFGDGNSILNGNASQDHAYDSPGSYLVTLVATNGCGVKDTAYAWVQIAQMDINGNIVDATCPGGADGSIDLMVNAGIGPFTFVWDNGATTEDISGLVAGAYNFTVTDANGCSISFGGNVGEPAAIMVSVSVTNASCGNPDGSATASASGGNGPYTYQWNDAASQATATATGLAAGNYTVTVADDNGCMMTGTASINNNAAPSAVTVKTDASCPGASDGLAVVQASGGQPPYYYLWNDASSTSNDSLGNLPAGTYCVSVTDLNLCLATACVTIGEPAAVSAVAMATNSGCNGADDGALDITPAGGTPPYTFAWDNGATTEDVSALAPGNHTVTITDDNGCTGTETFATSEPLKLMKNIQAYGVSCFGGADGVIDLSPSGGVKPYSYIWDNGRTTQDINGLSPGTYHITLTDANSCMVEDSAMVTEPAQITLAATPSDATCNGLSDGMIDLAVTGGTPPYEYDWDNGATTEDMNGLATGVYTVTVTDAKGCTQSDSYNIGEPTVLSTASSGTDVLCNGGSDGTATTTPAGGTPSYTYQWNDAASQTGATATGLSAGTYDVTVTDANGCTTTDQVVVGELTMLVIVTETSTQDATCGNSDGTAAITPSGGTGSPYTYLWNTGATSEDITGIPSGTYTVTVTDGNGCTATHSIDISDLTAPALTQSVTQVTCNGGNDGAIDLTAVSGALPLSYMWSTGATTEDISSLAKGAYLVTVTDNNGCKSLRTIQVFEPDAISIADINTAVSCNGGADGSVDITVSGGTPTYIFVWNNGNTDEDMTGLTAGEYAVTVTDNAGCQDSARYTVTEPAILALSLSGTNAACSGADNGSVDASATGGTLPYTYLWDNGATTEDLTTLAPGTYNVTVTDANGCTSTSSVTITEPTPVSGATTPVQVSCFNGADGSIDLTPSGGTPPYTFVWASGETDEDVSGLSAGTYKYTVTDANGCKFAGQEAVSEPPAISSSGSASNSTCGNSDGAVDLTAGGGTPSYTYLWSNGATTEDLSGLSSGSYTVTITDANGCTDVSMYEVNDLGGPSVSSANADPSCAASGDGAIDATPVGGTPNYTYLWNTGATTQDISGLTAGSYSMTVTDNNGCKGILNVTLVDPAALIVTVNQNGGSLSADALGGTPVYNYLWAPGGETTQTITGISPGNYSVTVTDDNGCADVDSITVITTSLSAWVDPASTVRIFPNPYRDHTQVTYTLSHRGHVEITVYDMVGRKITTLTNEVMDAGTYNHGFAAADHGMKAGTYLVLLRFGDALVTRRIVQMQ